MSSTTPGSEPDRPRDEIDRDPIVESEPTTRDEVHGVEKATAPVAPPVVFDSGDRGPTDAPPVREQPAAPVEAARSDESARFDEPSSDEPTRFDEPARSDEPTRFDEPARSDEPTPAVEPATPDATARLDAAVERANARPVASDDEVTEVALPEPIAADSVRRETYVPAATVAAGTVGGAATLAPEPEPVYVAQQSAPQTIYVQAPTPPKSRGNRGFGALVALIGTLVFAALYAGVAYLLLLGQGDPAQATTVFTQFVSRPVYWVPILAFFVGFALLAAIINRGAWWYYAVFGLFVGIFVYFSYIGAALLTVEAWLLTVDQARDFIAQRWLDPFAIAAAVIAREIPIWFGGWIAAHGRTVAERNRVALEEYERELAAGPQAQRG